MLGTHNRARLAQVNAQVLKATVEAVDGLESNQTMSTAEASSGVRFTSFLFSLFV